MSNAGNKDTAAQAGSTTDPTKQEERLAESSASPLQVEGTRDDVEGMQQLSSQTKRVTDGEKMPPQRKEDPRRLTGSGASAGSRSRAETRTSTGGTSTPKPTSTSSATSSVSFSENSSHRPIKLVRSDTKLTPGEEAAISFNTPTLHPSSYYESVQQTDRSFKLAALYGSLVWVTLIAVVLRIAPPESFERMEGIELMCTVCAAVFLGVSNLSRIYPLVYRKRLQAFSGVIIGACTIQFIAMMTNVIMIFFPTPVLVDPFTGGRVHLMRWAEWAPLAAVMTFITEGVDVPHPTYGMKIGLLHGLCQGISTLHGLIFPFVTSRTMRLALLTNACVLFTVIYLRVWQKYQALSAMDRSPDIKKKLEIFERMRLSLKLMATCAFVWTVLILSYFGGWLGPRYYPGHPILGSPSLPLATETFCELWSKVLNLLVIVDVHEAVFDESARAERRLRELRNMMSAVWESSSDVIAISVKSQNTGDVTTMVSPTFVRLERAMEGKPVNGKGDSTGSLPDSDGPPTKSKGDNKALVFELLAKDLKVVPTRTSSFRSLAGLVDSSSSSHSSSKAFAHRIEPKRVHYVELGGIPTQTGVQAASTLYRPETSETSRPGVAAMAELLVQAWQTTGEEVLMMHDIVRTDADTGRVRDVRCEAKVTRLDQNAVLVVIRDISERFRRFEAEKRVVMERTARQKDAEANRFTRHEVKNGLLAAIGLCDSLQEAFGDEVVSETQPRDGGEEKAMTPPQDGATNSRATTAAAVLASASKAWQQKLQDSAGHMVDFDVRRCMSELDATLREVLDTILAQSMARDVMHEVYEPKLERVDMRTVLYGVRGCASNQRERFPLVTHPTPLPLFLFDPQLLRFIHRNAVSNACKYGRRGGLVMTEIRFEQATSEIVMEVINFPGEHHESLMQMGPKAEIAVFEPGRRLHPDLSSAEAAASFDSIQQMTHSSGDGAWIMKKCANTMGGECSIKFEEYRTVFTLRCPAKAVTLSKKLTDDLSKFRLPPNTWGIAIDDSKIQRKLLVRLLGLVGIDKSRSIVLGEDTDEIMGFVDQVVEIIRQNPHDPVLVIADENLDVEGEKGHSTVSGSCCVQRIRETLSIEEEKRMLGLVRSANDSSEDTALYNTRAHGFLLKAPIKKDGVMETIAPWWIKRFQGSTALPSSESSVSLSAMSEDIGEIEVSSADIIQTLEVIDALCTHGNQSSMAERWPVIWEKLHVLKGDLKTLKDSVRVTAVLEAIDRLQGAVYPEDFPERWKLIRSLAVSIM